MKFTAIATATVASMCIALPALAHHSFSMFDHEKTVTMNGTVKEFEWTNPHAWIHMMAMDEKTGKAVEWSFEMGSVGQISAQGWKPDSIKTGDKITVDMHPLKDGSHGGQYISASANGHSFRNNQDNGRATDNVIR